MLVIAAPDLNIELDGQKWSFQPDPGGSGAYAIVDPAEACVAIPNIVFDQNGDPADAEALSSGAHQLWHLFADTNGTFSETMQPYCFLMSAAYTKTLNVKDNSTKAGAGIDAFPVKSGAYRSGASTEYNSQLWAPGSGEVWPIAPYALPPGAGLLGKSNYYLGNYVVDIVRSAKVAVEIGGDLICDKGVGFQFNGFGANGELEVWQQYTIFLNQGDTSLKCVICNWTNPEIQSYGDGGPTQMPIVYDRTEICQLPNPYIPQGTKLSISLDFDSVLGTITAVTFAATGPAAPGPNGTSGMPLFEGSVYVDLTQTGGVPSSTLAYQFVIVGQPNGAYTTFSAGSGRITYESNELISVAPSLGFQSAWDSDATPVLTITQENSNMGYGFLPPSTLSPATRLTQTFQISGPIIL